MQRTKATCQYCNKEISLSNISRHEEACKVKINKKSYALTHDGLTCQFCDKVCKNRNSLCNHERQCKLNPERQVGVGFDNFNAQRAAGDINTWNKGLTKYESESVRKQSESLSIWIQDNPNVYGGFRHNTAQKCKYGRYNGYYCDSSWELAFLLYSLDNKFEIQRCTESFDYVLNGRARKFHPDFKIGNTYYEIKGRYKEADYEKIKQFPKELTLVVIDKTSIEPYLHHCKVTYGKDFDRLYDRSFPSWMDKLDSK